MRPPAGPAAEWVRANIEYALAHTSSPPDPTPSARLAEVLLIEVLRLHLARRRPRTTGWAAALRDPVLNPALAAMHRDPATMDRRRSRPARRGVPLGAGRRFRQVLGLSPIRYLAQWRIHRAGTSWPPPTWGSRPSPRVGYDAEEAFSRAFKRTHGSSPGQWRARRTLRPSPLGTTE